MAAGDLLNITATDPGAIKDFDAFCKQTGNRLISSTSDNDGEYTFIIEKL